MDKWTREEKDQILCEKDEKRLSVLHSSIAQSRWRTQYHIQTVTGLMNDPNGFAYFGGKWHLFYQWFPFGAVHGMKHWYHVKSEDLLHWHNEGLALKPSLPFENDGCFSGSAYADDDILYLVYTGNSLNEEGRMVEYQMIGAMDEDGRIGKLPTPVIFPQSGYTCHQRDPHIFKEGDMYYILLGAQNENLEGKLLIYESRQIAYGWKFKGELQVKGYPSFGYMCECPDIERIGDRWLLMFCPQGLHEKGDTATNAYQSVYFTGKLDLAHLQFIPDADMQLLDYGFDFYAPQCANQTVYKNKPVMIGWFGCSDYTYPPTDEEGWANLQTLPRLLSFEEGRLKQRPVPVLKKLAQETIFEAKNGSIVNNRIFGRTPEACVIELENPSDSDVRLNLFTQRNERGFEIFYDSKEKKVVIDRSDLVNAVNTEYGTVRTVALERPLSSMEIFVDHSTVEIFMNDGDAVMTSRVFPTQEEHMIRMSGKDINLKISTADTTVKDDFVLFRK